MNLLFDGKKTPVIYTFLYIIVGIIAAFSSRISITPLLSAFCPLIAASFFALATCHIGILSVIPASVPFIVVIFTSGISEAVYLLAFVPLSLVIGLMLRCGYPPVKTVIVSTIVYILTSISLTALSIYLESGHFSFVSYFEAISNYINSFVETVSKLYSNASDSADINSAFLVRLFKSILVGAYICVHTSGVCLTYCISVIISRISKDKSVTDTNRLLNFKLTAVSSFIYIICFIVSVFTNISDGSVRFYSSLAQNLLLVLTPLFAMSGIFYVFKIKFSVEHGSPVLLIISLIFSFVLGFYPLIILYFSVSGALYSIRYAKSNVIKGIDHDTEK